MNELMLKWLNMLPPAAKAATELDNMMAIIHWLMLVLGVGWTIFFFGALIRFRKKRNPKANYHGVQHKGSTYIEIAVIVAEAVLLVGFAFPIWAKVVKEFPDDKEALKVRVVAEQFAWNFHYPGEDGLFGRQDVKLIASGNPLGLDMADANAKDDIVTLNQLYLPIDKPTVCYISSKDVIHNFGVYALRVKQDATPGLSIPLWFVPTKEGKYEVVCSQLCGIGHYRMRGFVNIVSAEKFEEWKKEQKADAKEDDSW